METKNVEIIPFESRYKDKYSLILVGNNTYKANMGDSYRVGLWEDDDSHTGYSFVDPSGGPFIEVGRVFPYNGRVVKSIRGGEGGGILIEFEE